MTAERTCPECGREFIRMTMVLGCETFVHAERSALGLLKEDRRILVRAGQYLGRKP